MRILKLSLLLLPLLLSACGKTETASTETATIELEGIIVTSAAPVVMANLTGKKVYLYFFKNSCESCWKIMAQAEPKRDIINIVGVVMEEDNFAVYEAARSHFINLLPVYADYDGNIAYDYNIESDPLWVSVNEDGAIQQHTSTPPAEVLKLL